MSKNKWFINITVFVLLIAVFFAMSGSYHEDCQTVNHTVNGNAETGDVTYYFADETSGIFKALSDEEAVIRVLVRDGEDVTASGKLYITYDSPELFPAAKHSATFNGQPSGAFYATELDDAPAIATDFSVTVSGSADSSIAVSVKYSENGTDREVYTKDINVYVVDYVICPNCKEAYHIEKVDGASVHKLTHTCCPNCNVPCVDGIVNHRFCEVCQTSCTHAECDVCGAVCDGIEFNHTVCRGCGSACVDGVAEHNICDVCGGECDGEQIVHGTCATCGGTCNGSAFAHGVCGGCNAPCVDGVISHAKCSVCGGECVGEGIVHADDCGVSRPPETSDFDNGVILAVAAVSIIAVTALFVLKKRAEN